MKWALLGFALAGCVDGPGSIGLPTGDLEAFRADVQPLLAERCATPTCHGSDERPLRVYAPALFRLDPARLHLDEPLDDEELALNYERVRGFVDPADPEASTLLRKPLASGAGGTEHEGGLQFEDIHDRGYAGVVAWIASLEGPE